jgi:hydroxymethylpyrimidine/phosphomethylpyrimidine kinase
VDLLSFFQNGKLTQEEFPGEHQVSNSTHGTGCAFSTALACNLARGMELGQSVMEAKAYVAAAIAHGQPIGRGVGPVNHLFRLEEKN